MSMEWLRFWLVFILIVCSLLGFTFSVIGFYRFGFLMNRLHASGIGDTFGILCMALGLLLAQEPSLSLGKMALVVIFLWFTSPTSSHFLCQVEFYTNPDLYRYVDREAK